MKFTNYLYVVHHFWATEACRWHEWNIIYLSGGRQRSYLAAARRVTWRPPEEINYLAAARRDKLSGGRQIIIWRPPEELRESVKITECFLVSPKP